SYCLAYVVSLTFTERAVVTFFFFKFTAPTEIYTLSYTTLFRSRDAGRPRPLQARQRHAGARGRRQAAPLPAAAACRRPRAPACRDRKSTRLNSSHVAISYAVFCLKKKTQLEAI